MLFDIPNQKHIGILIFLSIIEQKQNIVKMRLQLLSCFEFHVGGEQVMDIETRLICYIESDERQSAKPYHHRSFELELQQSEELTQREHQNSPKIISREYPKQLTHFSIIIGVIKVIEVEQPQCRKEHENNIYPGLLKRGKTKEKLTYNLICDKNDLTLGGSASRQILRCHSRLEQSHRHDGRDKHEYRRKEQRYARMYDMTPRKALYRWEVIENGDRGVNLRGIASDDIEEQFDNGYEQKGNKEGYYLREENQWQGEAKLLLGEGIADIDDIHDDQDDEKDQEIQADQEGIVIQGRHEIIDLQYIGKEVKDVVEGLPAIPDHQYRRVEGELHHLEIIHP